MIKRIFSSASTSVVSAAVIVASFSLLSRLVGFARDRILAGVFGAGDSLDVYYAAFRIPDFIFQLIVIGALSACFIPVFTGYFGRDDKKAWRYTSNIVNILLVAFVVIAVAGALLAPVYTPYVVHGFSLEKQALVVQATRILFLGQTFFAISMVFGSVLQGAKRFVLYSFAPIVNNLGILFGAIFLVPVFGLMGLAWGAVLGAMLHALIQTVGVYSLGYRYSFVFDLSDKDVRQTIRQMGPRVLGLAVGQLNFLLMTVIASGLAAGSVTVLQFAYNLNFFPIGVIGVSYAIAAFPTFCDFVKSNQPEKLRDSFSATIRQVMFFIIPITVVTLLLRAQIVRLVFGAGAFDWASTITTADTLAMFAISFFAQCLIFVLIRMFFAYGDSWTPFIAGIVSAVINAVAGVLLVRQLGVVGLAWAFSLAEMAELIMLWLLLKSKGGALDEKLILKSTFILSLAGLASAVVIQSVKYEIVEVLQLDSFYHVFIQTVVAGGAGLFMYFATAFILRSPEMLAFAQGLRARFMKAAKPTETVQQELV
ncbi:MAG: putative lipid flippase MurJ [Patescibacteria group bacterium]|jgi:putative peptidoglycan lipid II flippase|nr:putative lipid flippase MurJ [Patescibacteria group bacterium]